MAGSAFGLGGASEQASGGYGSVSGQHAAGAGGEQDVAAAMSDLPEDLRRVLGL